MKVYIVTGTPGTGKTRFAKHLAKTKKALYVPAHEIIKKRHLVLGYDKKLKTAVVDLDKLLAYLCKMIKSASRDLVIDSHLSHYLPCKLVDRCYVTVCDLRTLRRRLKKRKYNKAKLRENLDAEILQVCMLEAITRKHRVTVVDTSKKKFRVLK